MVKALTWTPDKLQILGIKKDTAQSLHSVLSVNEGGVLVNPDILDPALAAPFSVKSYTGGLHLHPAFTFDAVKYYTTASKTLTTVKEGAVTYLGTGVGGNLLFNPVLISLTVDSVPATMYIDDEILIEYSYAAVDSVKLYYSINAGAFVLAGTYPVAATMLYDTSVLTLAPGDTLTFKLVDAENTAVSSTASAITVLGVSLEITSLPAKAPVDEDITITWSSLNVATVDISVGLVSIVTDLDASLGTYTFQLDPLEFDVNASYTATLADHAAHADPDFQDIYTLATITHNSIEAMVAGVAKTITGTTNGASLLVYYRLHGAVSWTYAGAGTVDTGAGTWSYSLTLPTADTYDVLMVDGTDADAYAQQDSIVVASTAKDVPLSGGTYSFLANNDAIAYSWGMSDPVGRTAGHPEPYAVDASGVLAGLTIVKMASKYGTALTLASDGKLYAWGTGTNGQLGNGSTSSSTVPVAVDMTGVLSGKTIANIGVGYYACYCIDSNGVGYAWGRNAASECGDNTTTQRTRPVAIYSAGALNDKILTKIDGYEFGAFAIDSNGVLYGWGQNSTNYQFGNNTTSNSAVPIVLNSGSINGKTVIDVEGGRDTSFAICSDNTVHVWGLNAYGEAGNNTTSVIKVPADISGKGTLSGKIIRKIRTKERHTLFLDSTGAVHAVGENTKGQLGDNSTTTRTLPVAVDMTGVLSGKTITHIAVSGILNSNISPASACMDSAGKAYTWGSNNAYQIGKGTADNAPHVVPEEVNEPF